VVRQTSRTVVRITRFPGEALKSRHLTSRDLTTRHQVKQRC